MTSAATRAGATAHLPTRKPRVLFVASTGGHLAQLVKLAPTFGAASDSLWITFRSPQSESLLRGRQVRYVPYVSPRDLKGVLRTAVTVARLLTREHFDLAISTGAAVALSVLPLARLHRVRTLYIESVSRVRGPSLTGRLADRLHLAGEVRTQHRGWAHGRWSVQPSVLHEYRAAAKAVPPPADRLKVFVTLGTIHPYRMDSLVDALLATGLMSEDSVWQIGATDRDDLPGRVAAETSAEEFRRHCREADVVVTHAGVGTLLALLDDGVHPVVVPRRSERGEHVDDHQAQIAELIADAGVATVVEAPELAATDLVEASRLMTVPAR